MPSRTTGQAGAVTSPADTSLRADARRNRDQILAAAAHAFVASGSDVPMEEIARAAGVGVGTLYRRFADREALLVAVVEHDVTALLARIRTEGRSVAPERLDLGAGAGSVVHVLSPMLFTPLVTATASLQRSGASVVVIDTWGERASRSEPEPRTRRAQMQG